MMQAANESTFKPEIFNNPAFMAWAIRVGLRLVNKPPGSPDSAIDRAILKEGIPSPEWAQGLAFLMRMAWDGTSDKQREALARFDQGKRRRGGCSDHLPRLTTNNRED